jgi:hypothetical protein
MRTVLLFTRNGLGMLLKVCSNPGGEVSELCSPGRGKAARIVFYAEGVKLVCEGSLVLQWLKMLEAAGVECGLLHLP